MSAEHVTRILAIRHGETAWNTESRIQGHTDIPLNDTGLWQAERVAQALLGEPLEAVYTSDLLRARHTAERIAQAQQLSLSLDRCLRERHFGCMEGMTQLEIAERWPDQAQRWHARDPSFGPEGGETLQDFYDRCVGALTGLAQRHPGGSIAVVAHGGVLDCFYRVANRIPLDAPRAWKVGNATINRFLFNADGVTLIAWADDRHLGHSLDEISDGAKRDA